MYKKVALGALCVLVLMGGICSDVYAGGRSRSEKKLMVMSITQTCRFVGMPCDYSFRIDFVEMLFKHGIRLFGEVPDAASSGYVGTSGQNGRLARNIIFNRYLFDDGVLPAHRVRSWQVVY